MLYRDLTEYIESYYSSSRNALLLTGARQTGKTYSARNFGKSFESFIEINFIENPEAEGLFKDVSSPEDIYLRISVLTDKQLIPGKTMIFLDEIQECESIMTSIKFLVDDGKYRFILSGSLLGVELKDIKSYPVGYIGIKEVFPLSFREFIKNVGISDAVIGRLGECWQSRRAVDGMIHGKLLELFRLYLLVGGMPAAVAKYVETNNIRDVIREQADIVSLYRADISKYAASDEKLKIKEIFDIIPSELDAKNKRFILKELNKNAKYERYKQSFLWLKDAGVAIPVYNLKQPKAPLKLSELRNLFKLFLNDVGLLASQYADGIQARILSGDNSINIGAVYENAVAQELIANSVTPYYFNSKKQGEVDFVVSVNGKVVPVEIKSGKDYTRHRAMDNILQCREYEIEEGIIFGNCNMQTEGRLTYAPIYMSMFLKNDIPVPVILKIDLSTLNP